MSRAHRIGVWVCLPATLAVAAALVTRAAERQQDATGDGTRRLAAEMLAIPEGQLERSGSDTVIVPPKLSPPKGIVDRRWIPRSGYQVPRTLPRPYAAWVATDCTSVRGVWSRPASVASSLSAISERRATALASDFLRARGWLSDVRLASCKGVGQDASGRVTAFTLEFEGPKGALGPGAAVTVDALYSFVWTAWRHESLAPPPSRPPVLSLDAARTLVLGEVARRSVGGTIERAYLWTKCPGFTPGHPVYMVGVEATTRVSGGGTRMEPQIWYVDGWDGRVGRAGEFVETQRYQHGYGEWLKSKRPSETPGTPAGGSSSPAR